MDSSTASQNNPKTKVTAQKRRASAPTDNYLEGLKVFFSKRDNPGKKNASVKRFFELYVNTKFDESLLATCFLSVAKDKTLRAAQLEWLDDERLLVKCEIPVRQNSLVKALQTPEARSIVTVHHIQAADLENRQGFKEYREAGGRVITADALAIEKEKVAQLKLQNTWLSNATTEANAALELANAEIERLRCVIADATPAEVVMCVEDHVEELNAKTVRINELEGALDAKNARVEELDGKLEQSDCMQLESGIAALNVEIEAGHVQRVELESTIAVLNGEIEMARAENARLANEATETSADLRQQLLDMTEKEKTARCNERVAVHARKELDKVATKWHEAADKKSARIKKFETEINRLNAEISRLEGVAEEVGEKRARVLDADDLLRKMQAMVQATVLDSQVVELKQTNADLKQTNAELKQTNTEQTLKFERTIAKMKEANDKLQSKLDEALNNVEGRIRQATHGTRADLLAERCKLKQEEKLRQETISRLRKASTVLGRIMGALGGSDAVLRQVVTRQRRLVASITQDRVQREWDAMEVEGSNSQGV